MHGEDMLCLIFLVSYSPLLQLNEFRKFMGLNRKHFAFGVLSRALLKIAGSVQVVPGVEPQ